MQTSLSVSSAKLIYTKAGLDISAGGVVAEESDRYAVGLDNLQENLPDIIAYLQNETNLTRKTIVEILLKSKTLHLFKKNPQRYMEQVAQIITAKMRHMIVDGIKYTKIGDDEYYAQELFETEELTGYLNKNMIESKKSVYEYVVYDSANEERYMEQVAQIITAKMRHMIVDGIKYTKIGDDEYYAQELFETEELTGYLNKNMIESKKSVYEYVVYDSANEESFAKSFENNDRVKLYAKLPSWFTVSTPLGSYNPDWAVLIEVDGKDKLYFVLETKADIMFDALRPTESAKIKCGKKHFKALGNEVAFEEGSLFYR
jgi:restriction endonuclease